MKFRLTAHALREMERRGLDRGLVEGVLERPQEVRAERHGREAPQSRVDFRGRVSGSRDRRPAARPAGGDHGLPGAVHRQVLEKRMKARYDTETDTLTLVLSSAPVHESDEGKPGVILDYDRDGNVVSIEILDASKRVENPRSVEYLTAS
ncbi:MAG TPA: DUF2283 domain-containing protein [Burkholderiales bacterium]|nr:DUF2283 domain-containing protein [Burkholderiales bacterium]